MSHASGPRILDVDDEPNILVVVAMALQYQGFQVATAATGAEAIAHVNSFGPQLMVLDVMLPDMTALTSPNDSVASGTCFRSSFSPPGTRRRTSCAV